MGKEAWADIDSLEGLMKKGMAGVVADEFADSTLALKQLNAAACAPLDTPNRLELKIKFYTFFYKIIKSAFWLPNRFVLKIIFCD